MNEALGIQPLSVTNLVWTIKNSMPVLVQGASMGNAAFSRLVCWWDTEQLMKKGRQVKSQSLH